MFTAELLPSKQVLTAQAAETTVRAGVGFGSDLRPQSVTGLLSTDKPVFIILIGIENPLPLWGYFGLSGHQDESVAEDQVAFMMRSGRI